MFPFTWPLLAPLALPAGVAYPVSQLPWLRRVLVSRRPPFRRFDRAVWLAVEPAREWENRIVAGMRGVPLGGGFIEPGLIGVGSLPVDGAGGTPLDL